MARTDKHHTHTYDAQGRMTCCALENKIYDNAGANDIIQDEYHSHDHQKYGSHDHDGVSIVKAFLPGVISFVLLLTAIYIDNYNKSEWFTGWVRIAWYAVAYIPVGYPVIKEAIVSISKGEIFSEFFLMCIATIGAFAIGEYPEGVAVMLFYAVGEVFQTMAVKSARTNIKSLLDQRPDEVTVLEDNRPQRVKAQNVKIGEIIQLKPGEKLGLDGILLSDIASFNTAALTGESTPDTKKKGETVLAGMINLNTVSQVKVTTEYTDSKLSKILELVQSATSKKAPTELFIRKFAKIYTPIVVFLAVALCFVPYFFDAGYRFSEWLYRALIFLVISCPCALVISIPLAYFGGIGAASKNGILIKGSNFLDVLADIRHIILDKTGTVTEGVFKVQEVVFNSKEDENQLLPMVDALERMSTHPIATAIHHYSGNAGKDIKLENAEEIAGYGLKAEVNGKQLLVGNFKLMSRFNVEHDVDVSKFVYSVIAVSYDKKFAGYITVADSIKAEAQSTIAQLKAFHIKPALLSGDKSSVVNYVAGKSGISSAYGDLLPEDKVNKVKKLKAKKETVAFVGDGINDAPALALSDVGIAMGGLGSDATIEAADVVIQDDNLNKIPMSIRIGKQTRKTVWQNITLAFTVKAIVLILGAGGLATMWEAVFADVGVALLAILNAVRIQRMKY